MKYICAKCKIETFIAYWNEEIKGWLCCDCNYKIEQKNKYKNNF